MGTTESQAHWQKDEDVIRCAECEADFGVFTRRHHCRSCGKIYCDPCTNYQVYVEGYGYKLGSTQRVCVNCNKQNQNEDKYEEKKIEEKQVEKIDWSKAEANNNDDLTYESDTSPPYGSNNISEQNPTESQATEKKKKKDKIKTKKSQKTEEASSIIDVPQNWENDDNTVNQSEVGEQTQKSVTETEEPEHIEII